MEVILNKENFDELVIKSPVPVMVDFWAPWCGPCHVIAPTISLLATKYSDRLRVGKLNVDENSDIANLYQVHSIPTLKFFKNGQVIDEIIGVTPAGQLTKIVEKNIV